MTMVDNPNLNRAATVRELSACLLHAATTTEALLGWCAARWISRALYEDMDTTAGNHDQARGDRAFWGMRIWRWCAACSDRSRQRTKLAELDNHLLEDIGVARQQASAEAAKPFWR